jgi:hypothetical protein
MNIWTHPAENVFRRHYVGLDLGQSADPTALAVVEVTEAWDDDTQEWQPVYGVRHLHRWQLGSRYPLIVKDVARLLSSAKLMDPVLVVDRTGVGAPVCDLFVEADVQATIMQVHITAGSKTHFEDGIHYVPKKELVSSLQVPLQRQRLRIAKLPDRTLLEKELLNFRVKITADMNETFGAWREGQHDDIVLAVAMAVWAAQRSPRGGAEPFSIPNLSLPEIIDRTRRLPGRDSYPTF